MFKGNKKYLYMFIGMFALVVAVQYLLPKPVNWSRSYLNKDKSPFGCYAIFNLLDTVYSEKTSVNNQTFYNLREKLQGNSSLLLINNQTIFGKEDVRSLFKILEQGNNVFISANKFNGVLADTFHLKTRDDFFYYLTSIDSLMGKKGIKIALSAKNHADSSYQYSQVAWASSFTHFDTTKFSVLAVNKDLHACVIKARIGKGNLYLSSFPDMFGNYFIVNHKNRKLAYTLLSLLKNKHLVWDEYYKSAKVTNDSFLKFIIESDALYSAYLLLFFTLVLYMITEGRRRQRAIPEIEPVTNTTLEFVNVISHVYFNSKNHKSIALEKIKYFYEQVRKKFNVNTSVINEDLINEISEISGIEHKLVKQLFVYCEKIKTLNDISEYDLIELNRQISNFNKNSLR